MPRRRRITRRRRNTRQDAYRADVDVFDPFKVTENGTTSIARRYFYVETWDGSQWVPQMPYINPIDAIANANDLAGQDQCIARVLIRTEDELLRIDMRTGEDL